MTYCPGSLTKEEIEGVGYEYGDVQQMLKVYDVATLRDGWNVDGETGERFTMSAIRRQVCGRMKGVSNKLRSVQGHLANAAHLREERTKKQTKIQRSRNAER